MIHTLQINNRTVLLVEVPPQSYNFDIILQNSGHTRLFWDRKEEDYIIQDDYDEGIDLPAGTYTLLATSDSISEDVAGDIVEFDMYYCDYVTDIMRFDTAVQSFDSLLRSLKITARVAILLQS